MASKPTHKHAGMGGTFDHFHKGHQCLIDKALSASEKVSIGITIDQFSNKKELSTLIEDYTVRENSIKQYISSLGESKKVEIFPLLDIFGPTIKDPTIDSLVITQHTLKGAGLINIKRKDLQQPPLDIIKAELIKDNSNNYISSTRIRKGLIDRNGNVYADLFKNNLSLNIDQLEKLKSPFGDIVPVQKLTSSIKRYHPTHISIVGDRSLSTFIELKIPFNLGIFDNKVQRNTSNIVISSIQKNAFNGSIIKVTNRMSSIEKNAYQAITQNLNNKIQLIEVSGEEDLLVIPLIMTQPLNSLIFYGQPNSGIVMIKVSEDLKSTISNLITH